MKMSNQWNGLTTSLLHWGTLRAALEKFSVALVRSPQACFGGVSKNHRDHFSGNRFFNTL